MTDADELKLRWEILKQEKLDKRKRHDDRRQVRLGKWKNYEDKLNELNRLVVELNEEKVSSRKEIRDLKKSKRDMQAKMEHLERVNEALVSKLADTKEKFKVKTQQIVDSQAKQVDIESELVLKRNEESFIP